MNLDQVQKDIESWLINFVEVPHPSLGGWPPCPYARRARLDGRYQVRLGSNPYEDLVSISYDGLGNHDVVILAYDPIQWNHDLFSKMLNAANTGYLLTKDLIALEDHPDDVEIVNGVIMNQGTYALALVQSLGDLNTKSQAMASKGFYKTWPETYLQQLFTHRKDPREKQ